MNSPSRNTQRRSGFASASLHVTGSTYQRDAFPRPEHTQPLVPSGENLLQVQPDTSSAIVSDT
jgi:hypothetical protein